MLELHVTAVTNVLLLYFLVRNQAEGKRIDICHKLMASKMSFDLVSVSQYHQHLSVSQDITSQFLFLSRLLGLSEQQMSDSLWLVATE